MPDDFDQLIQEASAAPADTWDFGWLQGRATEERPSWRYFDRVAERVQHAQRLLDIDAGTGNLLADLPQLPPLAVATDSYEPSIQTAAPRLRSCGAHLVQTQGDRQALPFADAMRDLSEFLMGPLPAGSKRDPERVRHAAEAAGLVVDELRVERTKVVFYDIGAVVYFLRVVVWTVPDFTVSRYGSELRRLHDHIQNNGSFETTSSRSLIDARRPARAVDYAPFSGAPSAVRSDDWRQRYMRPTFLSAPEVMMGTWE